MGQTQLNVVGDESVIDRVKALAVRHQTDVNTMVMQLLEAFARSQEPLDETKVPPITRNALGLLKEPLDQSYKEALVDALEGKYGPAK